MKLNPGLLKLDVSTVRLLRLLNAMKGEPQTVTLAGILTGWCLKHRDHIEEKLEATAEAFGLTVEECERKLLEGVDLGEPVSLARTKRKERSDRDTSFQ
jgi:hypothetical protein